MSLADFGAAGEGDFVDAGMIDDRRAGFACAGDDVHHARRQIGVANDLGELHRRQRRRFGGLEHDGVARRQRRGDFPRRHQQREIPRNDLPRHAQRPRRPAGKRIFQFVRPTGVIKEMGRGQGNIHIARFADRLAAVHRLDDGELPARSCRMRAMR